MFLKLRVSQIRITQGVGVAFYFSAENGFSFQVSEYLANFITFRLLLPSERRIPKGFFERLLSACIIMGLFLCPRTDTKSPYCTESTAAYLHIGRKSPKSVQLVGSWLMRIGNDLISLVQSFKIFHVSAIELQTVDCYTIWSWFINLKSLHKTLFIFIRVLLTKRCYTFFTYFSFTKKSLQVRFLLISQLRIGSRKFFLVSK